MDVGDKNYRVVLRDDLEVLEETWVRPCPECRDTQVERRRSSDGEETVVCRTCGYLRHAVSMGPRPSAEEMRVALTHAARILGRTPGKKAYERLQKEGLLDAAPGGNTIYYEYGSWRAACLDAGLEPNFNRKPPTPSYGPRPDRYLYSEEQLLDALYAWYREHGTWPSSSSWKKASRIPSKRTYERYFGGWSAAIRVAKERFVEGSPTR